MKALALWMLTVVLCAGVGHAQNPTVPTYQLAFYEGDCRSVVEALSPFREAGTLTPEQARYLGLCYQRSLRDQDAVAVLSTSDTSDVRVLMGLGRSFERLGRRREALAAYTTAYRQDSTRNTVAAALARLLADTGRWKAVHDLYARMVREDPENGVLYARLGAAYQALDSTDQAIVAYEQARRLLPASVSVALSLSAVYFNIDHLYSARRVLDDAVKAVPGEPVLWGRRGEVALQQEDYPGAEASFREALARGDSSALALRNLGAAVYLQGRLPEADSLLTRAFARDSTDAMAAFYLGMARQGLQDYPAALHFFRKALTLMGQPMIANVHMQMAATFDQMKEDAEAIRAYRLALNLDPRRAEIRFHLAALYDRYYADPVTALRQYEAFLDQVKEGAVPEMVSYARQRVRSLRERHFFEQGRRPDDEADTSRTGLR